MDYMATVEYIRYRVPPHRAAEFEAACQRLAVQLAESSECVDFELSRSMDEPTGYVLRIAWTTKDARAAGIPDWAVEARRTYEPTRTRGHGGSVPTLYDWAGGREALERLTEAFYAQVVKDDLLEPLFGHMDPGHPKYVAMWLGEVFGGPARYTEERDGYPHMLAQHVGKAITEAQRRRWVSLLLDAADQVDLPSDPEFRAAFVSYIEWGTRLALANSQPGAHTVTSAPVPRWGWGVAPPYRP